MSPSLIDEREIIIRDLAMSAVPAANSKLTYAKSIHRFCQWHKSIGQPPISRAVLLHYRDFLLASGLKHASVNVHLSAMRTLAKEAAANGYIEHSVAEGIRDVKGLKTQHTTGRWLTMDQITQLLSLPPPTLAGQRDLAILALLFGCGLRRAELCGLNVNQLQQRDGRWILENVYGKGDLPRTVAVPTWAYEITAGWIEHAALSAEGRLIRAFYKDSKILESIAPYGIERIINIYSKRLGVKFTPHDLRRSFARLARKAGADIDQIQMALGHRSVTTTELYLRTALDLDKAACDFVPRPVGRPRKEPMKSILKPLERREP